MQKIIYLYGPSCAGKSTIARDILKNSKIYHIHYDILKWEIADYSRDNLNHRKKIQEQMMLLIEQKLRAGKSILIEGLNIEHFKVLKNTYERQFGVFAIKMTADKGVLVKRFEERLEWAKDSKKKISNKSLSVFLELYEKYNSVPELGITIDTSKSTLADTLEQVNSYLN